MTLIWWTVLASLSLSAGMVGCLEVGFRIGHRSALRSPGPTQEGAGAMEAAVFALLALLLGFSFAGGTSRLDAGRELIVQETNAIDTAYLRLDLCAQANSLRCADCFGSMSMPC